MKRMIISVSLAIVLATTAFAQLNSSSAKGAYCHACCKGKCGSACCTNGCTDSCCQSK